MLSIYTLGILSRNGSAARTAAHYYSEKSMDYYAKDLKGKEQGRWIGSGCNSFNIEGGIDRVTLQLALGGHLSGREVQNAGKPNRQMGWDLTFSAPKSVSVLWARADRKEKRVIEDLHHIAVKEAFRYLEQKAITRRGKNGHIKARARLVAGMFTHYTSRAGDPQLHSHVVIPNICARNDGSVGALHSREFYELKMTAGALFQNELAHQLREKGYVIEKGTKGTFRLAGLDKEVEKLFSKRGQTIDRIAKEKGIKTYAGTRKIAVNTRQAKQRTTLPEREAHWVGELKENGLEAKFIKEKKIILKVGDRKLAQISEKANQTLTEKQSVYHEKDIVRELARESLGVLNSQDVLKLFSKAQENKSIVLLGKDKDQKEVFSTPEMIRIEKEMIGFVRFLVLSSGYGVESKKIIQESDFISDEQKNAIESATGESQIAVIQGRAGSGKTTALKFVKQAYENEGYEVMGLCLAGNAARNLAKETGIKSQTIALWEVKGSHVDPKTVLMVDEAGSVGSAKMNSILKAAKTNQAKVILVGDEKQLQPIDAGGALRAVDQEVSKYRPEWSRKIETIKRQKHKWMRDSVYYAAQGDTSKAFDVLNDHNRISFFSEAEDAREKLVRKYLQEVEKKNESILIVTHQRKDTYKINQEIRDSLKEKGRIAEGGIVIRNSRRIIEISKGDKIVLTKNNYQIDVQNGQRAEVEKIDAQKKIAKIKFEDQSKKDISLDQYHHIEYGWAVTTYKAQGTTVDKTYVYGFSQEIMASKQATYVQISRQRQDIELFIVQGESAIERDGVSVECDKKATMEELKNYWGRDRAKDITLDYIDQNLEVNKKEQDLEGGLEGRRL